MKNFNTKSQKSINSLVTNHLYMLSRFADNEDAYSAAEQALVLAAQSFDPSRGVDFANYASIRINGAVSDELFSRRRSVSLPKSMMKHVDAIRLAIDNYRREYDCDPSCHELADITGIDYDSVWAVVHNTLSDVSLEMPLGEDEEQITTFGDVIPDEEQLCQQQLSDDVDDALAPLPPLQQQVLRRYYLNGEEALSISRSLNISRTQFFRLLNN